MYFKLQNLTYDLGDTPIENIFINDYLPRADGDFVKVFLVGYKLARESQGIKNYDSNKIASILNILESDVIKAWNYWESCGIINKIYNNEDSDDFSIEFVNLKELYIKNIYSNNPEKDSNKKQDLSILSNPEVANMITRADNLMDNRITYVQKQLIGSWIDLYNIPPALIIDAFEYSVKCKNVKNINYVEAIVRNWSIDNIRTEEALEMNFKKNNDKYYKYISIKRRLGLKDTYKFAEYEIIENWFNKYSEELIFAACDKAAVSTDNPNINYVNKILLNWQKLGISDKSEIEEKDKKPILKKKSVNNKFHNFKQLSDNYGEDYLEDIARKKREKFFKELGDS